VSDRQADLTREPEMVKAFRDIWHLGVHSYLAYLHERLIVARDLLADSGSIFLQIGDENVHSVRQLLEEIFGKVNGVAIIFFRKKTMPLGAKFLEQMGDYLLWFTKDKEAAFKKFRRLRVPMDVTGDFHWCIYDEENGHRLKVTPSQIDAGAIPPANADVCRFVSMWPPTYSQAGVYSVSFRGRE
jgi:adenine-specific DNA-methyltransferase